MILVRHCKHLLVVVYKSLSRRISDCVGRALGAAPGQATNTNLHHSTTHHVVLCYAIL